MANQATINNEAQILQLQTLIASVTAKPQPSYNEDGISMSWTEYLAQLNASLDACIARRTRLAGPFMVRSYGR